MKICRSGVTVWPSNLFRSSIPNVRCSRDGVFVNTTTMFSQASSGKMARMSNRADFNCGVTRAWLPENTIVMACTPPSFLMESTMHFACFLPTSGPPVWPKPGVSTMRSRNGPMASLYSVTASVLLVRLSFTSFSCVRSRKSRTRWATPSLPCRKTMGKLQSRFMKALLPEPVSPSSKIVNSSLGGSQEANVSSHHCSKAPLMWG
mmetsp:Transcript_56497/g.128440  ORF Transcript_56497/g.128440 Transcript_56497/m.128440 type:complete len:205 (+) Transcript_56497:1323-1937(+)